MPINTNLITKKELADKLRISVSKVEKDMRAGLPYIKVGKAVRFDYDKVIEYYEKEGGVNYES